MEATEEYMHIYLLACSQLGDLYHVTYRVDWFTLLKTNI